MGIDYGSKRVGIAFSDEAGLMAFPDQVLENNETLISAVIDLVNEKDVSEIVIGHSLGRDGEANTIHDAVTEFISELTLQAAVPIHLEPEQYTTQEAIRFQGRTDKTDAAAAAVILNSYIIRTKDHD